MSFSQVFEVNFQQTHVCPTDFIKHETSKGLYTGMIMLDLQKAFDTVDHLILCEKLRAIGVGSVNWFMSYLSGRNQFVQVNGNLSDS